MKFATTKLPLYHGHFSLVITNDPKDLLTKFTKDSVEYVDILNRYNLHAHALILNRKGFTHYTMVLNFESKAGDITRGTIAHEALHICSFLCSNRGIDMEPNNDEPIAYLIEWVVDWVSGKLDKWKLYEKVT